MKEQVAGIYKSLRNLLFSIVNREFLIFLFFLALSGTFWLLMTLNETNEHEYNVPVTLTGVPRNVVITSDIDDTLRVTIRDKGFTLAAYSFSDKLQPVKIHYQSFAAKNNGHGQIPLSELQRQLYKNLYSSSKIVGVKPDKLEFYYNQGQQKKVPVKLKGTIRPADSYYLARTILSPKEVTVYAGKQYLDSIEYVETENLSIPTFEDTITTTIGIKKMTGVKVVPSEIKVTLCPDILTEESIEVPIEAINMPPGKTLRTFPSRVKVRFVVGAGMFRQISKEHFRVVADYLELRNSKAEKCTLHLRKAPTSVKNPSLEVSQVDYLIEQ